MAEIRTTQTIRRSPSAVFAYATVPGNWPDWHPSSLSVSGPTERSLQVGESCVEEFVVAGRRGSCRWTVRERIEDRRWVIETEMQGERATISYTLTPIAEGTCFERVLRYRMPNLLLAVFDVLVLRRRIEGESKEATRRLKERLEDQN
jgi:hypothetical protein